MYTRSIGSHILSYFVFCVYLQAVQQLNMRVVLPGLNPEEAAHHRPLVVKRAAQQWRSQHPAAAGSSASSSNSRGRSGGVLPMLSQAPAAEVAAATAGGQMQAAAVRALEQAMLAQGGRIPLAQAGQALVAPLQQQLLQPSEFEANTNLQQQQQQQYALQQQSYALQQQQRRLAPVQQQQQAQQLMLTQQQTGMPLHPTVHQILLQQQQQQQQLQLQVQQQQQQEYKPVPAAIAMADLQGQLAMLQLQQPLFMQTHSPAQQMQSANLTPQLEAGAAAAGSPAMMSTYNLLPARSNTAAAAAGSSPGLPSALLHGLAVQGNSPGSVAGNSPVAVQGGHPAIIHQDLGLMQGLSDCDQAALGVVQGYSLPSVQANLQGHLPGCMGLACVQGNYQGLVQPQGSVPSYMPRPSG